MIRKPSFAWGLIVLAASPLLGAAAPTTMPVGTFTLATAGRVVPLTTTPTPAAAAPRFTPAPMPNGAIGAPLVADNGSDPELSPGLFRPKSTYRGEGFTDGSSAQEAQTRKLNPTPGINLKVPLN